jgi:phage antirepressor YoqD-like protein
MNELTNKKTMTVQEVANVLGLSTDVIKNCIRRIMPEKMENGKKTILSEIEVSEISKQLKNNSFSLSHLTYEESSQVKNSITELEENETITNAILILKRRNDEYKQRAELAEQKCIEQQPKVDFFDAVADSKDAMDMSNVAKILDCGMGRNQIFDILRNSGVLQQNNVPYQKFVDAGLFRVVEQKYSTSDGSVHINIKTLVYQKGIDYIRKVIKCPEKEEK